MPKAAGTMSSGAPPAMPQYGGVATEIGGVNLGRALRVPRQRVLWLIPFVVLVLSYGLNEKHTADVIGLCVALGLAAIFIPRPGAALLTLIVFLPIEEVLFAFLHKLGVPGSILRPASSFKELLGLCILVAALRQIRDTRERLDKIDIALLAYVGVATIYLIVPHLFSSLAPTAFSPRILAWRSDCGYPLVFFATRHAPIDPKYRRYFINTVLAIAALTGLGAVYQYINPVSWSHWILLTMGQVNYQFFVLNSAPAQVASALRFVFDPSPLHVGSIFFSPFDMGDYLLITIAICGEMIGLHRRSIAYYALLAASLFAIFVSQSRSDGLAAIIVIVLIALPTPRHPSEGRLRIAAAIFLGALIIVPSLAGSRFVGAQGGAVSDSGHISEIQDGIKYILKRPLGLGLGDQPSTAVRFAADTGAPGNDISDNSITQVGDELGLQALIPWLAMVIFVLLGLKRRAKSGDTFAAQMGLALLGILIAGQFHHVFLLYAVPWTVWGGAGLALSTYRPPPDDEALTDLITPQTLGRVP